MSYLGTVLASIGRGPEAVSDSACSGSTGRIDPPGDTHSSRSKPSACTPPGHKLTAKDATAPAQLRKGSFRDIMGRAKKTSLLVRQAKPQGILAHKAREKDSASIKKILRDPRAASRIDKRVSTLAAVSRAFPNTATNPGTSKERQKVVNYRGTMQAPASKKSGRLAGTTYRHTTKDATPSGSDVDLSSEDDMEAGYSDLEREEGTALRQARREDAEAASEEARLRTEKLLRKKKLLTLVSHEH